MTTPLRQRGKIKFFVDRRGYGYIERSDEADLFFHYSEIRGQDDQARRGFSRPFGQTVEFEVADGQRGELARNVREVK